MMFSWSISNLSSTSTTPSFVTSTVVLPGTKSLWMTNRSSLILMVSSLAGWFPNWACTYAPSMAIESSAARATRLFIGSLLKCADVTTLLGLSGRSRTLRGDVGELAVERDQVHALRRLRTELPQHRRHLATMIGAVVHQVLQHLPERLRLPSSVPALILDRPCDALGPEPRHDRANASLFVFPRSADLGQGVVRVG